MSSVLINIAGIRVFLFSLIIAALGIGCGKDEPTEAKDSVCDRLQIDSGQPSIRFDCNSVSGSTMLSYDGNGAITAIDFNFKCTNSSEQYTGRFHNIRRNAAGQTVSFDATVNGKTCHFP